MNELSLFTGIGGSILSGKELGWKNVGCVENDFKACAILSRNHPELKVWNLDIEIFNKILAAGYKGVDLITAGFPCQPFSSSGKRRGEADDRNQWPQTRRCIGVVRPRLVFLENVPGLLTFGYIRRIFGDLAAMGYDARWSVVSAAEAGAPHRRERLWILAYRQGEQNRRKVERKVSPNTGTGGKGLADNDGTGRERQGQAKPAEWIGNLDSTGSSKGGLAHAEIGGSQESRKHKFQNKRFAGRGYKSNPWVSAEYIECSDGKLRPVKPGVCLVVDGLPGKVRVPILKGLGNAWVTAQAILAWKTLTETD